MDRARVLVVFYSRTGFTRVVAQALARALHAELEELVDTKHRLGVLGYIGCLWDAARRRLTTLRPLTHRPEAYDLVVVGTPIWNAAVSSPVRTFLTEQRAALKRVAFFCTYGGRGQERVFRQMAALCGRDPLATMAVRDREVEDPAQDARIRDLVANLEPVSAH